MARCLVKAQGQIHLLGKKIISSEVAYFARIFHHIEFQYPTFSATGWMSRVQFSAG
jgi:hypothetical protein